MDTEAVQTQKQSSRDNHAPEFADLAPQLAASGLCVFPASAQTKAPLLKGWEKKATRDLVQIETWAREFPDARVAVACGPSGLLVIDLDMKGGKNGLATWAALCAQHGPAPATFAVVTPSGGRHLYFLGQGKTTVEALGPGVDVRSRGGLVVYYPVPLHNPPLPIAAAPAWLLAIAAEGARSLDPTAPDEAVARHITPASERRALGRVELGERAHTWPEPQRTDALNVLAGAPWGERGQREIRLSKLALFLVRDFPWLDPDATAELFAGSCASVEAEDGKTTTTEWVALKLREKIRPVAARAAAQDEEHAEAARIVDAVRNGRANGAAVLARLQEKWAPLFAATPPAAPAPISTSAANENASSPSDGRPTIRLSADLHESVDEAAKALANDPEIYQRSARIVRVVHVADVDTQREGMSSGTPQIRELAPATLTERLTRAARFESYDARTGAYVAKMPPNTLVSAVAERGSWEGVRPLVGIVETPSLRPDGSLLDVPGYCDATGYLYMPKCVYEPVPDHPTHADARAALQALREPWQDFPFRSEADSYVPIAALLTLVARPAIRGACPAFLFDASTRGSGKSLLARTVTTLAQGREPALMSWPSDEVELEKVLGSYALRGASVIAFDNVSSVFGGAPLDKVLTCSDRVELRILGKSETPEVAWRAVMLAGGNNLALGGDTTRRVLLARLEPNVEKPEERTDYTIKDLPKWCRSNHARLVTAALTLLRAYVDAGRPDQGLKGWGSFEQWQDLIASAIAWAGGADVTACRPTVAGEDDAETGALRLLLPSLRSAYPEGVTVRELLAYLYPADKQARPQTAEAVAMREALETLTSSRPGQDPDSHRVGAALKRVQGRVLGGLRVERGDRERTGTHLWFARPR